MPNTTWDGKTDEQIDRACAELVPDWGMGTDDAGRDCILTNVSEVWSEVSPRTCTDDAIAFNGAAGCRWMIDHKGVVYVWRTGDLCQSYTKAEDDSAEAIAIAITLGTLKAVDAPIPGRETSE